MICGICGSEEGTGGCTTPWKHPSQVVPVYYNPPSLACPHCRSPARVVTNGLCERCREEDRRAVEVESLRAALTREKERADAAEARLAAAAKVSPMCAENTDLRARAERAEEALRRLVERLDYVHADPAYQSVWTIAQMHVGPYRGPQYVEALIVARSALAGGKAP